MSAGPDPGAPPIAVGTLYHLVGVAGVGMSALAQALIDRGGRVEGSDRFHDAGRDLPTLRALVEAGVRLVPQDGRHIAADTAAVVLSSAIEADNAEIEAARRMGLPVRRRAEVLADLMEGRQAVAVAGTCGKTTVTGMLGWILDRAGFDPTVVNGGAVVNWRRPGRLASVRAGRSEWFVFEADESDRSVTAFRPRHAVLTNIARDHFSLDEAVALFRQFAGLVPGTLVVGPGVAEALGPSLADRVATPAPDAPPRCDGGRVSFTMQGVRFELDMAGEHNAGNAVLAAGTAQAFGVPLREAASALRQFRGIERRLERVGRCRGAIVLDDYAHNPEKIAAAWRAAGRMGAPVFGLWRPHGYGPLRLMMNELSRRLPEVMRADDRLLLLPVFYAGGTPGGAANSEELAERIARAGARAEVAPDAATAADCLRGWARPGAVLLIMGARDPDLPRLARDIAGEPADRH